LWFSALIAIAALPLVTTAWRFAESAGPRTALTATRSLITLPSSWATYIFISWAAFALLALMRMAIAFPQLHQLRKSCVELDVDALDSALKKMLAEFRSNRGAKLCVSSKITVPAAIGFFKPVVVLPTWLPDELTSAELSQVVLHELAHLQRRDDWTNLAQRVVKALLWFHPAAWWIGNQLSLEREMACDEAVLASVASPNQYAQCLVLLAEKTLGRRCVALAQAAVNRARQTSLRLNNILRFDRPASRGGWIPATCVGVIFAAVFALPALHQRTVVAFDDAPVSAGLPSLPVAGIAERVPSVPSRVVGNANLVAARLAPANSARRNTPALPVRRGKIQLSAVNRLSNSRFANVQFANAWLANVTWTDAPVEYSPVMQTYVLVQDQQFSAGPQVWLVRVWQVEVVQPADDVRVIPRKST
jgi:beta-lactamase regulating signal transducer with metallopeptidase domain